MKLNVNEELSKIADAIGCTPELVSAAMTDCKMECSTGDRNRLHKVLEHRLDTLNLANGKP